MRRGIYLAVLGALLAAAPGWGEEAPVAVSPGSEDGALIEDRCPTFSWGEVEGARGYDLVIYRLGEESEEAVPVLRQSFAGNVDGWTPALDSCLERGSRYAWSIRAQLGQELSEWSAPSLFQVSSGPTAEEFAEALQAVRQYLGGTGAARRVDGPWTTRGPRSPHGGPSRRRPRGARTQCIRPGIGRRGRVERGRRGAYLEPGWCTARMGPRTAGGRTLRSTARRRPV